MPDKVLTMLDRIDNVICLDNPKEIFEINIILNKVKDSNFHDSKSDFNSLLSVSKLMFQLDNEVTVKNNHFIIENQTDCEEFQKNLLEMHTDISRVKNDYSKFSSNSDYYGESNTIPKQKTHTYFINKHCIYNNKKYFVIQLQAIARSNYSYNESSYNWNGKVNFYEIYQDSKLGYTFNQNRPNNYRKKYYYLKKIFSIKMSQIYGNVIFALGTSCSRISKSSSKTFLFKDQISDVYIKYITQKIDTSILEKFKLYAMENLVLAFQSSFTTYIVNTYRNKMYINATFNKFYNDKIKLAQIAEINNNVFAKYNQELDINFKTQIEINYNAIYEYICLKFHPFLYTSQHLTYTSAIFFNLNIFICSIQNLSSILSSLFDVNIINPNIVDCNKNSKLLNYFNLCKKTLNNSEEYNLLNILNICTDTKLKHGTYEFIFNKTNQFSIIDDESNSQNIATLYVPENSVTVFSNFNAPNLKIESKILYENYNHDAELVSNSICQNCNLYIAATTKNIVIRKIAFNNCYGLSNLFLANNFDEKCINSYGGLYNVKFLHNNIPNGLSLYCLGSIPCYQARYPFLQSLKPSSAVGFNANYISKPTILITSPSSNQNQSPDDILSLIYHN